jgi:large subunit ribosomal protein L25
MEAILKAEPRTATGKGAARQLRADGRVPGILYGHGMEPLLLHVAGKDLLHLFHATGSSVLIDVQVDGTSHLAIPREIQRDHIHGRYVHIDLLAVRRDEKITLAVEVRETGEARGVKEGGVIEHHLRDIEVECLPGAVPEFIEIDVTPLAIGDMLRVRDIVPPAGIEILTDADTALISVITPAALRTEADLTLPGEEAPAAEEEGEEAEAAEGEAPPSEESEPSEGGES